MEHQELIPHLFRTEYSKITAVLARLFGFEHIEIAEDIASDTFLAAAELWGLKGLPENPVAWLYTVAKNKAKNLLRHQQVFDQKVAFQLKDQERITANTEIDNLEIDLSDANIQDSQLQMIFAVCHPSIPAEAQIGLALRILCGFGIGEIASAFLTNKETINKRLLRAKEKLRSEMIKIEFPRPAEMSHRLEPVLRTLYLLFNEGYYSAGGDRSIRKELCLEAMRLTFQLTENPGTDKPPVNALLALMCFHSSRFEARTGAAGDTILYDDQDDGLWDKDLIARGEYFLSRATHGDGPSKYHLEAAIAYYHSARQDTREKWENILQLYDILLQIEYSPMTALNRTYALSRVNGKAEALIEAQKLHLAGHHLYHVLLGELYSPRDNEKAIASFTTALTLAHSAADKKIIAEKIRNCC
jgi:RNA polymerase sigma factor (sigma-70 family)